MKQEFGGCLHFETFLNQNGGYFDKYRNHLINVDSGRSALQFILEHFMFQRIWLPIYNCPLVGERISKICDTTICWYNLKNDFFPNVDKSNFREGDCLLWVNYYGVMKESLLDKIVVLQQETPIKIILDNIPAYFSIPRMDAINIYSCRKFIGVPNGGHIIGNSISPIELPTYSTAEKYLYLLKAIESGSNSVYMAYKRNEEFFVDSKLAYGMPKFTKTILGNIDYELIKKKRKDNFFVLHDILGSKNRLEIEDSINSPLVYPYLCSSKVLRDNLLKNNVYVSCFWKHVITNDLANAFEKDLAEFLIPLPIDQRYEKDDMQSLAHLVLDLDK